jgi:hypothetical protein
MSDDTASAKKELEVQSQCSMRSRRYLNLLDAERPAPLFYEQFDNCDPIVSGPCGDKRRIGSRDKTAKDHSFRDELRDIHPLRA